MTTKAKTAPDIPAAGGPTDEELFRQAEAAFDEMEADRKRRWVQADFERRRSLRDLPARWAEEAEAAALAAGVQFYREVWPDAPGVEVLSFRGAPRGVRAPFSLAGDGVRVWEQRLCNPVLWVCRASKKKLGQVACRTADGWVQSPVAYSALEDLADARNLELPGLETFGPDARLYRPETNDRVHPMVLVVDYLRATLDDTPELEVLQ